MKTMLIGADGQLGSDIVKVFSRNSFSDLIPLTRPEIDITNPNLISKAIDKYHPEMIISTAAYHNVDACESHPEETFAVNTFGVRNLSLACQKNNIVLVHFSTNYVFGLDEKRNKPYQEEDMPGPLSLYGVSKLAGEYFMRVLLQNYFLVRTSGLYGSAGPSFRKGNFVDNVVTKALNQEKITVVSDQIVNPTYTWDLALNLQQLLKTKEYGIYHIAGVGQCSWYEFTKEILRLLNKSVTLIPVSTAAMTTPAKRPFYSVLKNAHLNKLNLNLMKPWQDELTRYLKEKKYLA